MKLLVIGGGGREHALVWKLSQRRSVQIIYCAPGNPGISELAECIPIKANDIASLKNFAMEEKIDLTIVGPEQPLVEGIVDEFESAGLNIFGPSKAAAQLEGSKVFAKEFMKRHNIPTAKFQTFSERQHREAAEFLEHCSLPIVIKADGLAAGKGVVICNSRADAVAAINMCFHEKVFADAGANIVIEEFMEGEEASIFALTDGNNVITLSPAQDHKRAYDNDEGKNTGGMGAYAPAPIVTESLLEQIKETIIQPTLRGMANEGHPYKGCLYVGLMITGDEPQVVEYNCRFGDPETQVILPLIDDDLAEIMMEIATGNLQRQSVKLSHQSAVCIVLASGGYPDSYPKGKIISGIEEANELPNVMVFHAGTAIENEHIVTSGGRVLGVMGFGDSLRTTIQRAYSAVDMIRFDDMHFRRDIGRKGIKTGVS